MNKYFKSAYTCALRDNHSFKRYYFGAVGIRNDGAIVHSTNLRNPDATINCHAETRLCSKLDKDSEVYVLRTNRNGSRILLARPCNGCQNKMKATGVKKVYYSISNNEFGQIDF